MINGLTRWWESVSLRAKITGVTVLVLAFGTLLAGVSTMVLLRGYLLEQLDQQLLAADAVSIANSADSSADSNDYYYIVFGSDGDERDNWNDRDASVLRPLIPRIEPDVADRYDGQIISFDSSAKPAAWHGVARTVYENEFSYDKAVVVLALPTSSVDAVMARYGLIFFGVGSIVVALGALITNALVRRTFQPLRQVERTAGAIAGGDFSLRLPGDTPNTEVGRLNRSLNMMLNRFDRAFADRARTIEQMRRFVGDASHELRTPLVTVRGYAELYRMGALATPEDVAQAMERIEKEAVRMGLLVEDLLLLARLDETRPLERIPVDLVPLAQDAARDAMAQDPARTVSVLVEIRDSADEPSTDTAVIPVIPSTGDAEQPRARTRAERQAARQQSRAATLTTGPIALAGATLARLRRRRSGIPSGETQSIPRPPGLPSMQTAPTGEAMVFGDENKIRQVIANLLANALRFTPSGSPLELAVTVDRALDTASVAIIDHGDGIPPQIREKVFQRFWRADTSRTRETGGSGLGLAIVAAIVQAHHGRVTIDETEGGGATFVITLPLLTSGSPTTEDTVPVS